MSHSGRPRMRDLWTSCSQGLHQVSSKTGGSVVRPVKPSCAQNIARHAQTALIPCRQLVSQLRSLLTSDCCAGGSEAQVEEAGEAVPVQAI